MLLFLMFVTVSGALFYYFGGVEYLYGRYGFRELEEEEKKLY
jgi:hypothetical protein